MPSLSKRASTVTEGSKGVSVLPKRERLAAVDLMGRSFAGTADKESELTVHWMIGPQLQEHDHFTLQICHLGDGQTITR